MEKDQPQSQFEQEENLFSAPDVDFSLPGFSPPTLNLGAGGGFGSEGDGPPLQLKGGDSSSDSPKGKKRGRSWDTKSEDEGKIFKKPKPTPRKRRSRKSKQQAIINLNDYKSREPKEEKKTKEPDHDLFLPQDMEISQKGDHRHFAYSGYHYKDDDHTEFSGSDDSDDEGYIRRIHGKNLSFKNQKEVKGKRGRTHNTLGFHSKSGMNNSHLIGDQMKGSGHHFKTKSKRNQNGHNLIATSDQYNKILMSRMEDQIKQKIGKRRFDMQVYVYYYSDNDPEKIDSELKETLGGNKDEVMKEMRKVLKKKKTKRVKRITYEVSYGKDKNRKQFKGEIGPDIALGTVDKESKKERAKRKKSTNKKKQYKVDLRDSELESDLTETDTLLDGDPSYRSLFQDESNSMDIDGDDAESSEG